MNHQTLEELREYLGNLRAGLRELEQKTNPSSEDEAQRFSYYARINEVKEEIEERKKQACVRTFF
tara:strand:+ start:2680 stop:2874 length:195 start_codon:yes stop_codon:yes gene_type:complete